MTTPLHSSSAAWWLIALAFLAACALTAGVRRYALNSNLLDQPNERSSHVQPTPRGGGVAIVAAFLAGTAALAFMSAVSWRLAAAVLAGGLVVAWLGFADDRRPLPARVRFGGHLAAAVWVTWLLGPLPALPVAGGELPLSLFGPVLAVVFLSWSINLFNFMDGIDGIAGIEAITVCAGGALLWAMTGPSQHWVLPLLLCACSAGFVLWNFPRARIFMGDAGSGFLGLMIGAFALWAGTERPILFWSWLILYGCFVVDATTTLIRRVTRGEKFHVAHRSHAYQYAARCFGSHQPVTLAIASINVIWLLPVAALVAFGHLEGVLGVLIAYSPLVLLAYHFKAGDRLGQEAA
jgi:Fuc2NAc and GlcNAc transferase